MSKEFEGIISLLDSTYKRYQEKPRWELIQAMMRLSFQLGYEAARCNILYNMKLKEDKK